MSLRKCYDCRKEINTETEKYAVLWILPCIGFLCTTYSEKEEYTELDTDNIPAP